MVTREGGPGSRFYLVAEGMLAVSVHGVDVGVLEPGDGFGEIALLRDGVRTATVTASEPAMLYALEREPFIEALTGSPQAQGAADALVAERLLGQAAVSAPKISR